MGLQDDLNDNIIDVVEGLEDILDTFKPKLTWGSSFRQALQDVVRKAVILDQCFCGQQGWYALKYPERRYDVYVDPKTMALEGSSHNRVVKFVIRPCLT